MSPSSSTVRLVGITLLVAFVGLHSPAPRAAGSNDEEYGRLVREATTKPEFLSPLVADLPRVEGVPTPKDVLGYIVGAPGS